jgi:hypothetical protein
MDNDNEHEHEKRVTLHTKITLLQLIIGMVKQSRKRKGVKDDHQ